MFMYTKEQNKPKIMNTNLYYDSHWKTKRRAKFHLVKCRKNYTSYLDRKVLGHKEN